MTSQSPFGVGQSPQAPSRVDVVPTWRDLPPDPPYGPVLPPRTPNLGIGFLSVVVEEDAAITPAQIAMAVGGTLLLVAIGIGAALFLLSDDDPELADVSVVSTPSDPSVEDGLTPVPPPVIQQPPPDAPQGELQPQPPGGTAPPGDETAPPDDAAPGGSDPSDPDAGQEQAPGDPTPPAQDGPVPPGEAPAPVQPAPSPDGGAADPGAGEEDGIDLPRLFRLRTLPSGSEEDATTVRQTTRGDELVTEQVTMLTTDDGEIGVRATRADDVEQRLEDLVIDDAQELNVRGVPAYLIDGQRLVWVQPGSEETLIEIEAPPAVETEALMTIANGLELLR